MRSEESNKTNDTLFKKDMVINKGCNLRKKKQVFLFLSVYVMRSVEILRIISIWLYIG